MPMILPHSQLVIVLNELTIVQVYITEGCRVVQFLPCSDSAGLD